MEPELELLGTVSLQLSNGGQTTTHMQLKQDFSVFGHAERTETGVVSYLWSCFRLLLPPPVSASVSVS